MNKPTQPHTNPVPFGRGFRGINQNKRIMNKQRRKELKEAIKWINTAQWVIDAVRDCEQESFENMPESIQESERGENMSTHVDEMDDLLMELESIEQRIDAIIENELIWK